MMVVTANQAPTLMNMLAGSRSWDMRWVPTADHEGVSEMSLMKVPRYERGSPGIALVCAPAQIDLMRARFPAAKVVWVAHNGYWRPDQSVFARVDACLAISKRVAQIHEAVTGVKTYFVSPAYTAQARWAWKRDIFVTVRSRPSQRMDDVSSVAAFALRGFVHRYFGQDQAGGFVDGEQKARVLAECSAYASFLHRSAGFGLAEHEAMALGAPIIGCFWGDMETEARSYPALCHSIYDLRHVANRLANDTSFAQLCSEHSLAYIEACRTQDRMDSTIAAFVEAVA